MGGGKKKHLLIIEDSEDLQTLLVQFFQGEGFEVSRAGNGRDALALLRSMGELPSVILLDVMMPIMDGIEFRDHQRIDVHLSKIPVVVMTADSNPQTKAGRLGVSDIIKKPISDLDGLLATIDKYLI